MEDLLFSFGFVLDNESNFSKSQQMCYGSKVRVFSLSKNIGDYYETFKVSILGTTAVILHQKKRFVFIQ